MPYALVDLSFGNGFSVQIFSEQLHWSGRSEPVIQFRVRDTQRVPVWTFAVQLTDIVTDGGDGPRNLPFLIARRARASEQSWFEADLLAVQAGGEVGETPPPARNAEDADAASSASSAALRRLYNMPPAAPATVPRPPTAMPPAHLVRP